MRKAKTPVSSKHQMLRLYKLILLNIRLKKNDTKMEVIKECILDFFFFIKKKLEP